MIGLKEFGNNMAILKEWLIFVLVPFIFCQELSKVLDFTNIGTQDSKSEGIVIQVKDLSKAKSFCLRNYVQTVRNQGLFTTSNGQFGFMLYPGQVMGFAELHKKLLVFPLPKRIPYRYEHFCFTHNTTHYMVAGEGKLLGVSKFLDDEVAFLNEPITDTEIKIGVTSFKSATAKYFNGKFSELHIFEESFSIQKLTELSGKCEQPSSTSKKLFDWSSLEESEIDFPEGFPIQLEYDPITKLCSSKTRSQIAFLPFPMTLADGNTACKSLGADVLIPTSQLHFKIVNLEATRIKNTQELQEVSKSCYSRIWMPVKKSNSQTELVDLNNKVIANNMKELLPDYTVENDGSYFQKCWIVNFKSFQVQDKNCETSKGCITCNFQQKPILRLRGLCEKSKIEDEYTTVTNFNYNGTIGKTLTFVLVTFRKKHCPRIFLALVYDI